MRFVHISCFALALAISPLCFQNSHAQIGNGELGDILEDIFGGQTENPAQPSSIDTIPVNITLDTQRDLTGHILILSAYAPPPSSQSQARPRLIGQTRILLDGLSKDMQLVIAAPAPVTRDLDFSRISAEVIDPTDNTALISESSAFYSGRDAAKIKLVPIGLEQNEAVGRPETVRGSISVSGSTQQFRGGALTVELVDQGETELAGGPTATPDILGQTRIDIDQSQAPFSYALDYTEPHSGRNGLALMAYITDWAGRRSFETALAVPLSTAQNSYNLTLHPTAGDTVITAPITSPSSSSTLPDNPGRRVYGQAQFDAYKGLPAGSQLLVLLSSANLNIYPDPSIARHVVKLDGLSGYIDFDFMADQLNPSAPTNAANIMLQIVDENGRLFFESDTLSLSASKNAIRLNPVDY